MRAFPATVIAPAALCLLLASCAQTGPPLPPSLELPKPPSDLRALRKGSQVTLAWSQPILTTDRQSLRYIGPTRLCRASGMEVADCRNPAATIAPPSDQPPKSSSRHAAQRSHSARPASQTFTDTLPAAMQSQDAASEVTYAVEVLNRNARSAGFSNQVHVPAIATVPPPADLSVNLTGDGVILSWTSARDSATQWPKVQLRYRIYRRDESSGKDAIAGEIPFGESGPTSFTDTGFEWEKTYLYRVTAVSILQRPGGEVQVEGDDTPPHRVVAHDVFPPATPTGLQAAYSGEGQKPFIDLIWAPVTNADLDGYNVYRSESNSTSVKPNMLKQNSSLVKSPAYRDSSVAPGKIYTYCVSAVDARRNESSCSEPASEPVP